MIQLSVFYDHITEACEQSGLSLSEVLKQVSEAGVRGIEINLSQLLLQEKDILPLLAKKDLALSCIYETFDFGNDPDLTRGQLMIDTANRLGVKKVLVVPGFVSEQEADLFIEHKKDYDDLSYYMENNPKIDGMVWALQELVSYARDKDVQITLEDYDARTAPYAILNGLKFFMERVQSLKFTIDCGNFAYSDEDAWKGYWTLTDRVVHCHCKDRGEEASVIAKELKYNRGLATVSCGKGYMPIERIVADLKKQGYEGYLAIEHFGAEKQLDTIVESAKYLQSLL